MLRWVVVAFSLFSLAGVYLALPIWTAFDLRRAVRDGDVARLEAGVDWAGVRASLKESLALIERDKQAAQAAQAVHGLPRPTLWQRIKAAATPARFSENLIDRYVSPEGVIGLNLQRNRFRALTGQPATDPEDNDPGALRSDQSKLERLQRFWSRLKRVEFLSPSLIELEMQDRKVAERRYVGTLELDGLTWKLTRLRVVGAGF